MEARIWLGSSASPSVSFGFSTKALMVVGSDGSVSITPNWSDASIGWRIAATVQDFPDSIWASSICEKSKIGRASCRGRVERSDGGDTLKTSETETGGINGRERAR